MAIKISNSTIIDDSRQIVNAGIITATKIVGTALSISGIGTVGDTLKVGTAITASGGIITATSFSGDTLKVGTAITASGGIITATSFSGSGATLNSIPNAALDNKSVSYGGITLDLGGTSATPAFNLTNATNYPYTSLTGIVTHIVGDTTPQLGGDLDGNSKSIYSVGVLTATQIADGNSQVGAAGSVLSSTGTGLSWVEQSSGGGSGIGSVGIQSGGVFVGYAKTIDFASANNVTVSDDEIATVSVGSSIRFVGARMYNDDYSVTASGSWTSVTNFDGTSIDTNSFANTTNGTFTIPAGVSKVKISTIIRVAANGNTNNQWRLYKNGSIFTVIDGGFNIDLDGTSGYSNPGAFGQTAIISVVEGDYFNISYYVSSTSLDVDLWYQIEVIEGSLLGHYFSSTNVTNANNITVQANNSTDETVYPIFVDGATGVQGPESDTGLMYNPSTGILTSSVYSGIITTAAQPNITSVGTLGALTVSGNISANGNIVGDNSTDITNINSVSATTLSGTLTGTATGLSGTPDITIRNLVGVGATFTGVVTYEDVTNVDSLGIVTARSGVVVVGGGVSIADGGLNVTSGITTFQQVLIGTSDAGHGSADDLTINNSGNGGITIRTGTSNNGAIFFADSTSGDARFDGFVQYNHGTNPYMIFGTVSDERLRITSGGQIGIQKTPKEWNADYRSLQIHDAGYIAGSTDDSFVAIGANNYLDASGNYDYTNNDFASQLYQVDGTLVFRSAASGTADNAITWSEKFQIAAAGQIGLGGANYGSSGQVITSNGSGSAPTWQTVSGGGGGGASGVWETNATGINTSTNVGIGTTTVSDATLVVDVGTASTAVVVQGSEGQLFSVTNSLSSGSIFSVNDISGVPSIDVDADGTIQLAPYSTTEYIGLGITNPTSKLHVIGDVKIGTAITASSGIITATSFSGSGASLTGLTGASAATYGDASNVAQIVVNSDGKITGISNVSISGGGGGGGGASGVWETNTTGINTSTNVGIGTTTASDATLVVDVGTASTALVIKGSEGQLFSVTNNLTSGSIFAVNDISGVPSINVDASGDVQLGPFNATDRVAIGQTSSGTKLGVKGSISERVYVVNDELSDIASDRINIDDGNVQYYSVAEDGGTLTPDITSTNGLNNDLAIGDSVTVVVIIKPNSTSDKITNITIDGSAATEEWLGGSAPDGGASGSYDVYTFFILKTADATFLPLCNKVNYA
mgnify:CR=1 FL=1